jgi:tRNA A-37 threonylcarbamoyl transferase component Bud32
VLVSPDDSFDALMAGLRNDSLERLADRFEDAWRQGLSPRLEDYVPPGEARPAVLVSLAQIDLERRLKAGQPVRVESYLERFPALAADPVAVLALALAEFDLRKRAEPGLAVQEYQQRFPALAAELALRLGELDSEKPTSDEACLPATRTTGGHCRDAPAAAGLPSFAGYEVLSELGQGGMGVVYKVHDRKRAQTVALKTLREMRSEALFRFKREFRLRADLSHPNLVTLYELVADGPQWFFTMEYVAGVDLLGHVQAAEDEEGRSARLRQSLAQLAEGIAALHQAGKLHRDVKPSNVLVTPQGRVVLLDFGLVGELDPAGLLASGEGHLVGTIPYMSPEQAGGRPLSAASDWYSVGVILYEALTGLLPFPGSPTQILHDKQVSAAPDPRTAAPSAPDDLAALCAELLRRDPAARPAGPEVLDRLAHPAACTTATPRTEAAPLIGRERHLAALADALAALDRDRPVVVRILGSSGVGKSALVQRFLDGVRQGGRAVALAGRCYEQESVPYKALDGVIDALSRFLRRLSALEVEALLPRDVGPLLRVFPVLRRVEALARAPRLRDTPDPQEVRRRAFTALRELLGRLADRRPLVFCVDDLQWGDADSAGLLAELLRPPGAPAVLFLGCYRSEELAASAFAQALEPLWPQLGDTIERRELRVEALSPSEARQLAERLLGSASATAEAVARESGGIPFFVQELVESLRLGAAGTIALDEVLWGRITRLPAGARDLLTVVTLSARPLPQAVALRTNPGGDFLADLALLRAHRLTWGTGAGEGDLLLPYHDRVREAVQAHLSAEETRGQHRRLAEALEAWGGADAEWLALHWERAGRMARAGEHYARAADHAADALAFDHAALLYRSALRLGVWDEDGRRSLRRRLGDALANAGRGEDSAREYLVVAETITGLDAVELRRRAATQLVISGHVDEGLAIVRSVLQSLNLPMPATRTRTLLGVLLRRAQLWFRGVRFRQVGSESCSVEDLTRIDICYSVFAGLGLIDPALSAYFLVRGLLLALKCGEPYRVVRAMTTHAAILSTAGGSSRRRTQFLLGRAEQIAGRLGSPHAQGLLVFARGAAHYCEGCWRAALAEVDAADEIFRKDCTGVAWELDTARTFALWSMTYIGCFRELHRRWPALLAEARNRGDRYAVTNLSTYIMAVARLADDAPEQAQEQLHQVMEHWSRQGFHVQHHNSVLAQVLIHLYQGNGAAAFQHIQDRWALYKSSLLLRIEHVRINIVLLRAQSALAAVAATGSKTFLNAAVADARRLEREKMPWSDALVPLIQAGAAALRGDGGKAIALLRDAVERLNAVDMYIFAEAARRRLGQLLGGDEGRRLIAQSEAWMANQGVRKPARMAAVFAPGFPD